MPRLKAAEAQLSTAQRLNPVRLLESAKMVEKTYAVLNGAANQVDGPVMAGILGGLRSISTAAQLKGAILSAIPGDSVTSFLAGNFNGIPASRLISGVPADIARSGAESKNLAARLNLTAHSAMDFNHGYRFFQDQVAGPAQLRFMATTVVRAQGLQAWTEMMKRVFSMEFTGHLADHVHLPFADLQAANKPLANFLERYGITRPNGTPSAPRRCSRPTAPNSSTPPRSRPAPRREAAHRHHPGAPLCRAGAGFPVAGDHHRRAGAGHVPRRNQPQHRHVQVVLDHHGRDPHDADLSQETWGEMAKLGMPFVLTHFMVGAAAMQAKNLFYGKDPQAMDTPKFWVQALAQGGGLGVYGDMLNSAFTKSGRSFQARGGRADRGASSRTSPS
jgi:hypothetical protein